MYTRYCVAQHRRAWINVEESGLTTLAAQFICGAAYVEEWNPGGIGLSSYLEAACTVLVAHHSREPCEIRPCQLQINQLERATEKGRCMGRFLGAECHAVASLSSQSGG
jgi:uncharacterized membrane protein YhdT